MDILEKEEAICDLAARGLTWTFWTSRYMNA